MQNFSATPREIFASAWRNRSLIYASTKRDVFGRYRGSFMGVFWSFLNPLFMLAVYTFVFGLVFKARWSTGSESNAEFALILFAGLIVYNLFAETINRAPTLILANPNYVKKVVFPLEVLPLISLGSSLFHCMISLLVWLIVYVTLFGWIPLTILYLPIILIPLMLLILGLSWMLASLGVFLRDISQMIGIATTALLFLSPIFYPASALPEKYQYLLNLNPLTPVVEYARGAMYWGRSPDLVTLAIYAIASGSVSWLGFACFQKSRKGFADVI